MHREIIGTTVLSATISFSDKERLEDYEEPNLAS